MAATFAERAKPVTLALLRVVGGFLFWQHGVQKLFGWFGGAPAQPMTLFWWAGVIETALAPFIVAGIFTRLFSVVLFGEMMAAYFTIHLPMGFWPLKNGGEIPLQYALIFLLLATAGPGGFHLESLVSRRPFGEKSGMARALSGAFPFALNLSRIVAAILFLQYGFSKSIGALGGRIARFPTMLFFAGIIETIGAPLVALGLFARCVCFVLSGEMAVGYWTSHFPRGKGHWPIMNQGEPAVLFCFLFLFLWSAGPGSFSLDALRSKNKR